MEKLLIMRKRKGQTQSDVSKALGVSVITVSRWENGESMPSGDNLIALAKFFGCNVEDIVGNYGE